MNTPLISVLIPVYNGASYIEEAINSVFKQSYKKIELLISVDLSTDNSIEICKKYERSDTDCMKGWLQSVRVYVQDRRLGWVANCNYLLEVATGDYVSILPCDDLLEKQYLEKLLNLMTKEPKTINCYPTIQCIGNRADTIRQPSILDLDITTRIFDVIDNHLPGVSFRGLIDRRRAIQNKSLYFLRDDQHQDIWADTIWILQHAILGQVRSNDEVIYYKRFHNENEHLKWPTKPFADLMIAWARHCATMFKIASPFVPAKSQDILLQKCTQRYFKQCHKRISKQVHNCLSLYRNELSLGPSINSSINSLNTLNSRDRTSRSLIECIQSSSKMQRKTAIVLGAGLQGCCVALMLHKYDYDITIIDQCTDIMNRASMNQEGKIHLGFVYSLDKSQQTSSNILEGALNFAHYMEYLLDQHINWDQLKSEPFHYLVPKTSLLSGDEIEVCFNAIQGKYKKMIDKYPHLSYLGSRPTDLYKRVPLPATVDKDFFVDCFATEEVAISQKAIKMMIKAALTKKKIKLIFKTRRKDQENCR